LDGEAAIVAAAKAEVEAFRATAARLLAQMRATEDGTAGRIAEVIGAEQKASQARMDKASSEWHCEKQVLDERILACEAQLPCLHGELEEARSRARRLRRRTACVRLGRAAAAWRHELSVRELKHKARRARAAGLRKMKREGEAMAQEVIRRREALNKAVRLAELEDGVVQKDSKAEMKCLRDELEQLEDHIESVEERMRHQEILADTVAIVPLEEGDRIRKWAEVASSAGSANFREAKHRLHNRSLMLGLHGEQNVVRRDIGGKLRGSSSTPSLPSLRGGLQGLEDRIQGCRR